MTLPTYSITVTALERLGTSLKEYKEMIPQ